VEWQNNRDAARIFAAVCEIANLTLMPFTPYHLGPGLLLKSVLRGNLSFMAFAVTQVIIDCETLYHLLRGEWPVHRTLHSYLGSVITGTAVGVMLCAVSLLLSRSGVWHIRSEESVLRGAFASFRPRLPSGASEPATRPKTQPWREGSGTASWSAG
jgi:hypothetical protein